MLIKVITKLIVIFFVMGDAIAATDLVIMNANIIDPAKKLTPQLGYIVLHDDKINKIGFGEYQSAGNVRIIDAKKQYIIPGLIDSHNHVDSVLGMNDDQMIPALRDVYRKQLPNSYLYFGYTTVVDLSTTDKNAIHVFNANATHPDLYSCGGAIMIANGYPMHYYPENIRFNRFPNFLYEANQNNQLPKNINPNDHTPAAIMKRIQNAHAICVKIFYEPGFGEDKNLPLPSLAAVKEIVTLAHQHHLPVLMHANSLRAQQFALDAGVDIFAHGMWNWNADDNAADLPLEITNVLNKISKKQLGYQPTMQVIHGLIMQLNPNFLNDKQLLNVVPNSLLNWYKTNDGQWYTRIMIGDKPITAVKQKLELRLRQVKRVVNYLQKQHANLLFGTDTPSSPTYGNPPGYNGYLEMQNWYNAGVPLPEILTAATIRNARFLHLENKYGSIASGKIANLLIMAKNPLTDISAYDAISAVVLHGKIYKRALFSANQSQ